MSVKTKEEILDYMKRWYQANKAKKAEYYQINKAKRLEYQTEYRKANKEKVDEYGKKWRELNKDKISVTNTKFYSEYYKTPYGRASRLVNDYNQADKAHNRGKGDLTAEWVVENIFSKPCAHCGITGWEVIGCNRLNNALPHTKNNVEPCCFHCNCRLPR